MRRCAISSKVVICKFTLTKWHQTMVYDNNEITSNVLVSKSHEVALRWTLKRSLTHDSLVENFPHKALSK